MSGVAKLVAFDMDGVLVDIVSSWVHVHRYFGVNNDHSLNAYLRGEIDDREFIRRDVKLWKDKDPTVTIDKIRRVLETAELMPGARETLAELRARGIKSVIVSAGIDLLAERVARELSIDMYFANGFVADCTGKLVGDDILNVGLAGKGEVVTRAAGLFGVDKEDVVSVGNSRYDIPMFDVSACGLAFCPEDEEVRDRADHVIEEKDLREILRFV